MDRLLRNSSFEIPRCWNYARNSTKIYLKNLVRKFGRHPEKNWVISKNSSGNNSGRKYYGNSRRSSENLKEKSREAIQEKYRNTLQETISGWTSAKSWEKLLERYPDKSLNQIPEEIVDKLWKDLLKESSEKLC